MKEIFLELCKRIGINKEGLFKQIELLYSEPYRFYHNLTHIKNCLDEFSQVRLVAEDPDAVEFAIWYHDAIYDTKAKDNEEKSAHLAYKVCLGAQLSETFAQKTRKIILVTKHIAIPSCIDEKIMVDVDLSIFGKSEKEFDEYEKNIRKEYSWAPEKRFVRGRKKILKEFLNRPTIFITDFFREKYERQARINLKRSLIRCMQLYK